MRAATTDEAAAKQQALRTLPGVTVVETELTERARLLSDLDGLRADVLVSCIATRGGGPADSWRVEYTANANLLAAAGQTGAQHVTLLSAICVQKPRLQFQLAKTRFEALLQDSGLSYSIVRPTAFFKSLCGQLERVRAGKPFLVFGSGTLTACKPISEGDLARFIRATLEDPALHSRILPIGGPGPALTPLDQVALLTDVLGREVPVRRVPPQLLRLAAGVLSVPARVSSSMADKAEFARIGHYYATESMLLWDATRERYDADATPEFGSDTLSEAYRAVLTGQSSQSLGEHSMFSRD